MIPYDTRQTHIRLSINKCFGAQVISLFALTTDVEVACESCVQAAGHKYRDVLQGGYKPINYI